MDEGQPILLGRHRVPNDDSDGAAGSRRRRSGRGSRRVVHPIVYVATLLTSVLLGAIFLLDLRGYLLHHHLPTHHNELSQAPKDGLAGAAHFHDATTTQDNTEPEEEEDDDYYYHPGSFYNDFNDQDVDDARLHASVSWTSIVNILGGFTTSFITSPELNVSWVTRPAGFGPHIFDPEGYLGELVRIGGAGDGARSTKGCDLNLTEVLLDRKDAVEQQQQHRQVHDITHAGGPPSSTSSDDRAGRHSTGGASEGGGRGDSPANETRPSRPPQTPAKFAMVERGECPFIIKILNAQAAGFDGVVVYNDEAHSRNNGHRQGSPSPENGFGDQDELVSMWSPSREASRVKIPSVFVGHATGKTLLELLQASESRREAFMLVIEAEDPPHLLLMDVIILLFFLPTFFTMFVIVLSRVRMMRQKAKLRAPRSLVDSLPTFKWRENLEQDLEALEVGEKGGASSSNAASDKTRGADATQNDDGDEDPATAAAPSSSAFSLRTIFQRSVLRRAPVSSVPSQDINERAGSTSRSGVAAGAGAAGAAENDDLSAHKVKQLARKIFSQRECSICLSDFAVGERVKLLPCGHLFHEQEIDNWLIKSRKWCPVCRCSIGGEEEEDGEEEEGEAQGGEEGGLAGPTGSGGTGGRSTTGAATAPAVVARGTSHPHQSSAARPIITRRDLFDDEDEEGRGRYSYHEQHQQPVASSSTTTTTMTTTTTTNIHERTPLLPRH